MKKKYYFFLLLFLPFFAVSSQTTIKRVSKEPSNNHRIKKKSNIVLNSQTKTKKRIQKVVKKEKIKNRTSRKKNNFASSKNLQKSHSVKTMDSIWKEQLYSSDLYDTIYNSVRNLTYDPVVYNSLSTEVLKERLKKLNNKTPFNIEYNPILESVIKNYLKSKRGFMERAMMMSGYFFPLFEKELDNYNIPMEIKFLAIVESGLRPNAKSGVGATGLWQFMYETGKMFDLRVNSYVDERMDPVRSTKAACEYLSSLYKMFGDWDLALAAYNSGPGNVMKAIRRAKGSKNYWNIRHYLPRETAGYLPAFLTTMYIFEYAKEHGFNPKRPQFVHFETDTIQVKQKVTFKEVAKAIDINVKELKFLNPSYKLGIIPKSEKKKYDLRLPIDRIGDFIVYEEKLYALANEREEGREKSIYHDIATKNKFKYKVRRGDYLSKIAVRFGTTVSFLKQWNNISGSKIRTGQYLTIYMNKKGPKKIVAN